jgi:hypothetical protein
MHSFDGKLWQIQSSGDETLICSDTKEADPIVIAREICAQLNRSGKNVKVINQVSDHNVISEHLLLIPNEFPYICKALIESTAQESLVWVLQNKEQFDLLDKSLASTTLAKLISCEKDS